MVKWQNVCAIMKIMQVLDLRHQLKNYASKWVVLSSDYKRVLASATTLPSLLKKSEKGKTSRGYVLKVAKDYSHYIGNV